MATSHDALRRLQATFSAFPSELRADWSKHPDDPPQPDDPPRPHKLPEWRVCGAGWQDCERFSLAAIEAAAALDGLSGNPLVKWLEFLQSTYSQPIPLGPTGLMGTLYNIGELSALAVGRLLLMEPTQDDPPTENPAALAPKETGRNRHKSKRAWTPDEQTMKVVRFFEEGGDVNGAQEKFDWLTKDNAYAIRSRAKRAGLLKS